LKKQSQFVIGQIECKAFFERNLWQNDGLKGTKKQSQLPAYGWKSEILSSKS